MKKAIALSIILSASLTVFSQKKQALPSVKELPKTGETKQFYELPQEYEYVVFDMEGNKIEEGKKQFIDTTKYKKGTYFIKYNGETVSYIKK